MAFVTIVIPVGPGHGATGIFHDAIESANAQTLPCDVIVQHDKAGRGAAWSRNTAMRKVKTDFVVYLDADDLLDPAFVEQTVKHWKPGRYVYTDYRVNGILREVPAVLNPWEAGQQHITPTLLPTAAWRAVGGFDETLDTLEDEDFYRKLHAYGWCGIRCPGAWIEYRRKQGNSRVNQDRHDFDRVWQRVQEKAALFERRYQNFMGCGCKDNAPQMPQDSAGDKPSANMVLAKALYSPMRKMGPVSGTIYPRQALGAVMWVDMDDVAAAPDWWQKVAENPVNVSPDIDRVRRLVNEARQQAKAQPTLPSYNDMSYNDLRKVAKEAGIKAVGKRAELIEALQAHAQPA